VEPDIGDEEEGSKGEAFCDTVTKFSLLWREKTNGHVGGRGTFKKKKLF